MAGVNKVHNLHIEMTREYRCKALQSNDLCRPVAAEKNRMHTYMRQTN